MVQRSLIIPASGSLYSGEPVGCSCLFPTLRKKELPSVTHQRQRPAQCTGRAFFMQMNEQIVHPVSSRDNPSQGTTFSCASTGRRQLCPTATPLSWDVCSPLWKWCALSQGKYNFRKIIWSFLSCYHSYDLFFFVNSQNWTQTDKVVILRLIVRWVLLIIHCRRKVTLFEATKCHNDDLLQISIACITLKFAIIWYKTRVLRNKSGWSVFIAKCPNTIFQMNHSIKAWEHCGLASRLQIGPKISRRIFMS